jgi:hypothetical protein
VIQDLVAVSIKMTVFWNVAQYSQVKVYTDVSEVLAAFNIRVINHPDDGSSKHL